MERPSVIKLKHGCQQVFISFNNLFKNVLFKIFKYNIDAIEVLDHLTETQLPLFISLHFLLARAEGISP